MLVRRTALRCAAAGAVSGLPSGLLALGTLGAELAYLVFQQFRLILGIATIYGHEPSQRERFTEAMSCLAYASGVGIGKQGIATMLESATVEGGMVAEKLGANFFRERLTKVVPFVGVALRRRAELRCRSAPSAAPRSILRVAGRSGAGRGDLGRRRPRTRLKVRR